MRPTVEVLANTKRLPSLPPVAVRVIELARQEEPDFREITTILRADPALAARILRTANSALFALPQRVHSIEAAIPILGLTMLRTIVLGFTLADHRGDHHEVRDVSQLVWRSSLAQAAFAEMLALNANGADPSTWFLTGLLQDVGVLATLNTDTDNYLEHVWDNSQFPNVVDAERKYYRFTHIDVGRELFTRWGLPREMIDAMVMHHAHMQRNGVYRTPLMTALQASSLAAHYVVNHGKGSRAMDQLLTFVRQHYGWDTKQTEAAIEETAIRVGESAALFNFDVGENYSPERILADARDLLEEIALTSQLETRAATASGDAMTDPMSGAHNRRYMDNVLNRQIADHVRTKRPLGMLFLDIDKFKNINDGHGHQIGDQAIVQVADVLKECVGNSDSVIRYGGDEFLVALLDATVKEVQEISELVRSGIAGASVSDDAVAMTTSIGAVFYEPIAGDPLDANWLIDCVDAAMYEAKRGGGNQVSLRQLVGCEEAAATT